MSDLKETKHYKKFSNYYWERCTFKMPYRYLPKCSEVHWQINRVDFFPAWKLLEKFVDIFTNLNVSFGRVELPHFSVRIFFLGKCGCPGHRSYEFSISHYGMKLPIGKIWSWGTLSLSLSFFATKLNCSLPFWLLGSIRNHDWQFVPEGQI